MLDNTAINWKKICYDMWSKEWEAEKQKEWEKKQKEWEEKEKKWEEKEKEWEKKEKALREKIKKELLGKSSD